MTIYGIALFLHVLGALGMFAALGIEWAADGALQRATDGAQARSWLAVLRSLGRVNGPSALAILVTGIYMGTTAWGRQPWIGLSLLGLVFLAVMGARVTGRRMAAVARELHSGSAGDEAPRVRLRDPVLALSLRLRTMVALGIVFLMTTKPGGELALAEMSAALLLGAAWAAPAFGRRPAGVELAP